MSENIFLKSTLLLKREHLLERKQCKLFELDNAGEMLKLYIPKYALCDEAELRLLNLNSSDEQLKNYLNQYVLSDNALENRRNRELSF